jgi:Lrp/AsnC family leucine-responsive transcriptional regulator
VDTIDRKVLNRLMTDGRASWAELGAHLGLSAPAAADRVRRLEQRGVIRHFAAVPDPALAGYPVLAFVFVTLLTQSKRKAFLAAVGRNASILECHHVAGDDDYLLKVRCTTMGELDELLSEDLKGRMGVARTRTTVVLGSAKETSALPSLVIAAGA